MNMKLMPDPPAVAPVPEGCRRRLFTRDEYRQMTESGFFAGQRVQLIGGEIIEMAAQSNWHALVLKAAEKALEAAFGPDYWVRVQNSLDLSPRSVPDPDLAVIAGSYLTHRQRENPTSALLVVEVSETTLTEDRVWKAGLYAAAGIADYWILNIRDKTVEVRRQPLRDKAHEFGFSYGSLTTLDPGADVSPLALPAARIAVTDLLPL